jgi:carbon-monoxide dehydrogenase large subunit
MATKKSGGYIGRALKRVEDPRLIQGIATYVDDLNGWHLAAILRSPTLTRGSTRSERGRQGGGGRRCVFIGADVNDKCGLVLCASLMPEQKAPKHTALANDRVYFVGHAVAVVVAKERYAARDALDLIESITSHCRLSATLKSARKGLPLTHRTLAPTSPSPGRSPTAISTPRLNRPIA